MKRKEQSPEFLRYLESPEWSQLRELTLQRDNRTCQICGATKKLQAHHIRYTHLFNERNYPEDLICVCATCHERIHRYYRVADALKEHYRRNRQEKSRYGKR